MYQPWSYFIANSCNEHSRFIRGKVDLLKKNDETFGGGGIPLTFESATGFSGKFRVTVWKQCSCDCQIFSPNASICIVGALRRFIRHILFGVNADDRYQQRGWRNGTVPNYRCVETSPEIITEFLKMFILPYNDSDIRHCCNKLN